MYKQIPSETPESILFLEPTSTNGIFSAFEKSNHFVLILLQIPNPQNTNSHRLTISSDSKWSTVYFRPVPQPNQTERQKLLFENQHPIRHQARRVSQIFVNRRPASHVEGPLYTGLSLLVTLKHNHRTQIRPSIFNFCVCVCSPLNLFYKLPKGQLTIKATDFLMTYTDHLPIIP